MKILFACLVAVVACSSTSGDEADCAAIRQKDDCVAEHVCAWGTSRDGPACFYVGEVEPQ